ncbi:MAG TPA: adenylate kinase family protein [Nitrososphaerales archaeon]|nr:adenylate kinase family protein [Nitrososphaerales archaeon]
MHKGHEHSARKSELHGVVGITGTPGTGKKSIAPILASSLGLPCMALNDLARSYGLIGGDSGQVDTGALKRRLASALRHPAVVYGHLFPYVFSRASVERVAVLRCEPTVLKERLLARGYPPQQLVDNLEAELIGLIASDAFRVFGKSKTFEVDTTYFTPAEAAASAAEVLRGGEEPVPRVDWTANYDSGLKLRTLLS